MEWWILMHDKRRKGCNRRKIHNVFSLVSLYGGGQKTQQKAGDQAEIEQQERNKPIHFLEAQYYKLELIAECA